ncbi:MAG: S26 family signal peptidase [Caulobacterales bacterium]
MVLTLKKLFVSAAAVTGLTMALLPHSSDLALYNHSKSMPVGLYWRIGSGAPAKISKASIVTVRAKDVAPQMAAARHFNGPQNRFIKHVAAVVGDKVCADGSAMVVNDGVPIPRRRELPIGSAKNDAAPIWSGCRVLHEDEVLLLGETADSFDGRYWGPVSLHLIEGVWRKI